MSKNILLAMLMIVMVWSEPVSAKMKVQIGDLKIVPSIDYNGSYNDNIYAEEGDTRSDYVHTLTPGFQIEKGNPDGNFLVMGYDMDLVAYNDFDQNNFQAHNPFIQMGFRFPALRLSLNIDEQYLHTADLSGTDNEYNVGKKTRRWNNTLGFTLAYDFGNKYNAELTYQNFIQRFDDNDDKWQNRMDHEYGLYLFYKLTGKTSFFLRYGQTFAQYDKQNDGIISNNIAWNDSISQDYRVDDYSIGVRFKPVGRLDGTIRFGYDKKKPENDTDPNGNSYEDESSWIAETLLNYKFLKKNIISYKLQRLYESSPYSDSSSYLETFMGITLNRRFTKQISVDFGVDWSYQDYSSDKSFNVYNARTSFNWQILDWFTAGLGYEYKKKNTSDDMYEDETYENDVLFFSLDFDLSL